VERKELEAERRRKTMLKTEKEEKKKHRKDLKQDVKNAWSGDLKVAASEKDTDVAVL
jgi:hypothetical protein